MMKKFMIGLMSVIALMLVLTGCGNDDKKIQQNWIKSDSVQGNPKVEPVMIFEKGHEFEYRMSNAVYAKGHYELNDDHHIKMKSDIKSMNTKFNELSGDFNKDFTRLTLKNGQTFEPYKGDMGDEDDDDEDE